MNKKNCFHIICLLFLTIMTRALLLYLIEPADYSIFFNHTLKNKAKANDDQIDMIILGTSRPHRTFDPVIFEEVLGLNSVYNASSGLQPIEASYYMAREIIQRYHPKYMILDITAGTLYSQNATLEKVIVLDRLHGINKLEYLINCFEPEEYLNALSLCYRFRNNFTADKIRDIVEEKKTLKNNGYTERWAGEDLYTKNGFIYSYQTGKIDNTLSENYNYGNPLPKKMEYLNKIVNLCGDNGIQLFLVTSPWSMMFMYTSKNYQDFTDFMTEYASAHNLSYFNLNYLRGRETWLGDDLMFDAGHVNGAGAELVSEKYAQILKSLIRKEEIPDLLYEDISEVKKSADRILGIGADISIVDLTATVHISSTQTENIDPLYRVQLSTDDVNFTPLTDWTSETDFRFPMEGYKGTAHFLIEAMSPTGEPGVDITYHIPI